MSHTTPGLPVINIDKNAHLSSYNATPTKAKKERKKTPGNHA